MSNSTPTPATTIQSQQTVVYDQSHQDSHRIKLINKWSISPGSKLVEIGCGQGNCTEVLAKTIGPSGHVDGIDPAPLDYGCPETLGQAQARLSKADFGPQIGWHQASPIDFLNSAKSGTYDTAIFCHSIWYFASPQEVLDTFVAARGKAARLCIAEYALSATEARAVPHVLAALARGALEAHKSVSTENIRTALAPSAILKIAEEAGWKLVKEDVVVPDEGLEDGRWETGAVVANDFLEEIEEGVSDEKVKVVLRSMREAVKSAVQTLEKTKVMTMDVWVATFE